MKSIAFPLLSSGIHRYPKEEAASVACEAVNEYFDDNPKSKIEVTFYAYTDSDEAICNTAYATMLR